MKANEAIQRTGKNGRYSSCVVHNNLLYIGGTTTTDIHADTAEQAKDIFRQLDKLLAYHNTNKHNIISVTVQLTDMADFGAFNSVWDIWVDDDFEPCITLSSGTLSLPSFRVQISLVAAIL